jgi:hypothetical protein
MTIKSTLLILPLLLLFNAATGQAEKTFVKSFNLMGRQTVVLNLGDNIQTTTWDNDVVRIQMTVNVSTTDATLKALAESSRYMLKSDLSLQDLTLTAPNLANSVKLNGTELKENILFMVYVPKNVTVLRNTDSKNKIVAKISP